METEKKENGRRELLRRVFHFAAVLTAVCLVSGGALSLLYVASAQRIKEQAGKALDSALDVVIGDAADPVELVENTLWVAERPEGSVRYAAIGSARGYQSEITVLASADGDADKPVSGDVPLYRLVVLSSAETPGLGENINAVKRTVSLWAAIIGEREEPGRPWFQIQFEGRTMDELSLKGEDGRIEPVTGATETSAAAALAARKALETIIEKTAELYD